MQNISEDYVSPCACMQVLCSLVGGRYILEVKLFGYSNPSGSCSNCQGFCCDGVGIQPPNCSETLRCDSFFRYCLTPLEVAEPGNCFSPGSRFSLPNRDDRVLDFTQSNVALGLENPLQLPGLTNDYRVSYHSLFVNVATHEV